jgi:hypothetical protein
MHKWPMARAEPIDQVNERCHVGGIAQPHLRAHRPPVAVDQHSENHLAQIRPMVLAETMLAERLPAQAFEIQAGWWCP